MVSCERSLSKVTRNTVGNFEELLVCRSMVCFVLLVSLQTCMQNLGSLSLLLELTKVGLQKCDICPSIHDLGSSLLRQNDKTRQDKQCVKVVW